MVEFRHRERRRNDAFTVTENSLPPLYIFLSPTRRVHGVIRKETAPTN